MQRFNNSILKRHAPKTNKLQQYCCLAVGSRDRSLSVWMTALQRPLVVIHDLFQDTILDLSWSTDRNILLACSTDGTVACLQFTSAELGTPLSEDDKNALYQRMYGKSANIDMNEKTGKGMIIEYAEMINNDDKSAVSHTDRNRSPTREPTTEISVQNNNLEMLSVSASTAALPIPAGVLSPKPAIHKQIETRRADGRRRITPMFIPLSQELSDCAPELNSSSRSTSTIMVDTSTTVVADDTEAPVAMATMPVHRDPVSTTMLAPKRVTETAEKTQLSSRLSTMAPVKSKTVLTEGSTTVPIAVEQQKTTTIGAGQQQPTPQHQSPTKFNVLSAGKAIPLQGTFARWLGEYRVNVSVCLLLSCCI